MDKPGLWYVCLPACLPADEAELEKVRARERLRRKRRGGMLLDCLPLALHSHSREEGIIYNPVHGWKNCKL